MSRTYVVQKVQLAESRVFEPPKQSEIGSKKRDVRKKERLISPSFRGFHVHVFLESVRLLYMSLQNILALSVTQRDRIVLHDRERTRTGLVSL